MPHATPEPSTDLVTVAEAARTLRVTERCLRGWIADGTVPAYRIGEKAIRIKRCDLQVLLQPVAAR
ncbi:helix-turn-helix domain-containing protein [Cellulomonas sp. ACRRI]|uniref:helix-turn-helix domain-containing protein n=1 Tax=Cellulomonas sp. ACRRI TaxID=2918188 RepID=UPI001EF2E99F|nr:helix-turn-helix domain-containing protein [Cellulomonas sp. ACRRI]MCG7284991.1 helix-turn-helix domain-containing protein [Cellulomonas sp. ACRRI]